MLERGVAEVIGGKLCCAGEAVLGGAGGSESRFGSLGSSGSEFKSDSTFTRFGSVGVADAVGGCADETDEKTSDRESSLFGGDGLNVARPVNGESDVVDNGGKFTDPKRDREKPEDVKLLFCGESGPSSRIGL